MFSYLMGCLLLWEQIKASGMRVLLKSVFVHLFFFVCYYCMCLSSFCTQAKLRLEMETERQRQTHSKDIESKDEEVEEIRRSCSKKVDAACPLSLICAK